MRSRSANFGQGKLIRYSVFCVFLCQNTKERHHLLGPSLPGLMNDDRRRRFQPCSTRPYTRGIDVIKFWVLHPLIARTPSLTLVLRCIKVRVVWGVIR